MRAQSSASNLQRDIEQLQSRVRKPESENRELERNQRKLLEESGGIGVVLILFVCTLGSKQRPQLLAVILPGFDIKHRHGVLPAFQEC